MKKQLLKELTNYRQHTGEGNMAAAIQKYGHIENAERLVISDFDVIALIYTYENTRISDLLPYTDLTQGAVSKILTRLVRYGLVEKYHQPQNKKDTYLRLTDNGQIIAKAHADYHKQQNVELDNIFNTFTEEEISKFIELMTQINAIRTKDQ